jgi:hypothetical protein
MKTGIPRGQPSRALPRIAFNPNHNHSLIVESVLAPGVLGDRLEDGIDDCLG